MIKNNIIISEVENLNVKKAIIEILNLKIIKDKLLNIYTVATTQDLSNLLKLLNIEKYKTITIDSPIASKMNYILFNNGKDYIIIYTLG